MKKIFTLLIVLSIQNSYSQELEADYLFSNVSIISMNGKIVLKNKNIALKNGKIIAIDNVGSNLYNATHKIDLKGKFIMPTLSDAHVHLPDNEEDLKKILLLNLINGVTKLRSMRGDWEHAEFRNKFNTENSIYPKMYLSSPPMHRSYEMSVIELESYVQKSKKKGFDFIKILSIKDEALFIKLDSICKINDIQIGGHFPSNVSDSLIFKSNYTSFEHLGGLAGSTEFLENRLNLIKEKNIFICPTLSWYSVGSGRYSYEELRNLSGMKFIPKTTVEGWIEKTKKYREKIGSIAYKEEVTNELKSLEEKYQIIKKANDLGINMLLSPDSSSKYMVPGFSVFGEIELLKKAQLSNYDILKLTTINFAKFFHEKNYGTIEVGKDADFLILNDNPLENIETLKHIEAIFFNSNYINNEKIEELSKEILPK